MKKLLDYGRNIYSQNDDGVIEEILKRLEIENGFCCEFGAWDGKYLSNTFNLIENKGWNSLLIEGDEIKYKDLLKTFEEFPNQIKTLNCFVQPNGEYSLNEIFIKLDIKEVDLLSIDIDSYDYQIMESLKYSEIKPKIIIIEINSAMPINEKIIHGEATQPYGGMKFNDSSFRSTLDLGHEMGYTFVCHTANMIFVRNDLIKNNFDDLVIDTDSIWRPGQY